MTKTRQQEEYSAVQKALSQAWRQLKREGDPGISYSQWVKSEHGQRVRAASKSLFRQSRQDLQSSDSSEQHPEPTAGPSNKRPRTSSPEPRDEFESLIGDLPDDLRDFDFDDFLANFPESSSVDQSMEVDAQGDERPFGGDSGGSAGLRSAVGARSDNASSSIVSLDRSHQHSGN